MSMRCTTTTEDRQVAVQELWKAIDAGDPAGVMMWAETYAALLRGEKVSMWDFNTGEKVLPVADAFTPPDPFSRKV